MKFYPKNGVLRLKKSKKVDDRDLCFQQYKLNRLQIEAIMSLMRKLKRESSLREKMVMEKRCFYAGISYTVYLIW